MIYVTCAPREVLINHTQMHLRTNIQRPSFRCIMGVFFQNQTVATVALYELFTFNRIKPPIKHWMEYCFTTLPTCAAYPPACRRSLSHPPKVNKTAKKEKENSRTPQLSADGGTLLAVGYRRSIRISRVRSGTASRDIIFNLLFLPLTANWVILMGSPTHACNGLTKWLCK